MRVRLTASPGQAGQNRFTIRLSDYDTAEAVRADRVSARFRLPAHPETSQTTLELAPAGPGTYGAEGGNLTLPGRWLVTVLVERGGESLELPLNLLTRFPRPEVTVARVPGRPTLTTGFLSQDRSLQVFVDPERPGAAQLHVTFFGSGGGELPLRSAAITTTSRDRAPTTASARRVSTGHFVADIDAAPGPLEVEVTAVTQDGEYVFSALDVNIPS
jgi:nitrogen fixation protein FixH